MGVPVPVVTMLGIFYYDTRTSHEQLIVLLRPCSIITIWE